MFILLVEWLAVFSIEESGNTHNFFFLVDNGKGQDVFDDETQFVHSFFLKSGKRKSQIKTVVMIGTICFCKRIKITTKIKCFPAQFESNSKVTGLSLFQVWIRNNMSSERDLSPDSLQYLECEVVISSNIHHVTNLQKEKQHKICPVNIGKKTASSRSISFNLVINFSLSA